MINDFAHEPVWFLSRVFFGSRPGACLEVFYFHARDDVDTEIDIDYQVLRGLFEKFSHASIPLYK